MTRDQTLTVTVPISMSSFFNAVHYMPHIINSRTSLYNKPKSEFMFIVMLSVLLDY